jgi:hypothetical protein
VANSASSGQRSRFWCLHLPVDRKTWNRQPAISASRRKIACLHPSSEDLFHEPEAQPDSVTAEAPSQDPPYVVTTPSEQLE